MSTNSRPTAETSGGPPRIPSKRDSMRWWNRVLAFLVLTWLLGELVRGTDVPPLVVTAVAAVLWVVLRFVVRSYDDVAPPDEPRRPRASLPHVRPEPPRTIPVLADNCEICGRTLTRPESRLARVGTECVKVHGPRSRGVANPDHDLWNREMARARVEKAEHQVELDREHAEAVASYRRALKDWNLQAASPEAAVRRRSRRRIKRVRSLAGIAIWVAAWGHVVMSSDAADDRSSTTAGIDLTRSGGATDPNA